MARLENGWLQAAYSGSVEGISPALSNFKTYLTDGELYININGQPLFNLTEILQEIHSNNRDPGMNFSYVSGNLIRKNT